ncbi:MAG: sigma-70 family RNA polymerase sigma factor [Lachnospiraceae bacterium]|nr:sigma-70 family RNA polymerase sigma factor [Lachnospiraceae bacterium]
MDERETRLFYAASRGDTEAFESFIIKYEKLIYNAAYRMLPTPSDAEDIAQEVIIKVYNNLEKCKNPLAFKSWLFRIINNTCIDEIRKRSKNKTLSLDKPIEEDDGPMEINITSKEPTPEENLMRSENIKELEKAIGLMSDKYKSIVVLRDINGLSYEEIAYATKLNPGTVKSRLSRGRKNLKDILLSLREQT